MIRFLNFNIKSAFLLICLIGSIKLIYADDDRTESKMAKVTESFVEHEIVPDILDAAPNELIEITFNSGVSANLGNELAPNQVKDIPTLKWKSDPKKLYTLLFLDPDAPSRSDHKYRNVRHWHVVNIPGSTISDGETLIEYIGSGPPEGTALHRYIYLIYEQSSKFDVKDEPRASNRTRDNRLAFNHQDWIKKYNLGNPIAGNFYQAQFDDYVPVLHAQLSNKN